MRFLLAMMLGLILAVGLMTAVASGQYYGGGGIYHHYRYDPHWANRYWSRYRELTMSVRVQRPTLYFRPRVQPFRYDMWLPPTDRRRWLPPNR